MADASSVTRPTGMKPSYVMEALRSLIPAKQPVYLEGPPGVAKSSLIWQAASSIWDGVTFKSTVGGRPDVPWYREMRGSQIDPVEVGGIPYLFCGTCLRPSPSGCTCKDATVFTKWAPSWELPTEGEGVLCVEEIPQSTPAAQAMLMELLLDRRVRGRKLGDGWAVVGTGNRAGDRAGAMRLLTTNASRVIRLSVAVNFDDWQAWAVRAGVIAEVRSFLHVKRSLLHRFDAASERNPDPRGWERVSMAYPHCSKEIAQDVVAGIVDDGPAGEFIAHTTLFKDLPTPATIFKDPEGAPVPQRQPAILHAICGSLADAIKGQKAGTCAALVKYANRLPMEFGMLLMRDATALNSLTLTVPAAVDWIGKHKDLVLGKPQ
jgi:hypothetical protein